MVDPVHWLGNLVCDAGIADDPELDDERPPGDWVFDDESGQPDDLFH